MLATNIGLVRDAQEMFQYKGMDIRVIIQKYLLKAADDGNAEINLVYMIVAVTI